MTMIDQRHVHSLITRSITELPLLFGPLAQTQDGANRIGFPIRTKSPSGIAIFNIDPVILMPDRLKSMKYTMYALTYSISDQ